jgi:hypothetical protein
MRKAMSPINKVIFRVAGLFTLVTGVIYFSITVLELVKLTTVVGLVTGLISLVINCIAIYGGFQLFTLKELGRRLVIIWLCCQMLTTILVVFGLTYNLLSPGNFQMNFSSSFSPTLLIIFYLCCIMTLVFLLVNRISIEIPMQDYPHWHNVAKLLSLFAPGLGIALIGNLFLGIILFYVYGLLMTAKIGINSNSVYLSWLGQLLYYLVVWRIFSSIDWNAVKGIEKTEEKAIDAAPQSSSG